MTLAHVSGHVMNTYKRWEVEFVKGRGATLYDAHGRSYIDLVAGIAVASVGHAHPMVAEAIAEQSARLMHVSNLYLTRPQAELSDRLAELTGGMLSFFCNSGAEAIECALKLARRWARSSHPSSEVKVICAEGGFHGRTFGALAATGQPAKREPFAPMLPGFIHVPFGDADALAAHMDDSVCAVLLEPIQGEAGIVMPPDDYLESTRALCDRTGALLILDEIQTGLGRTGQWFAHQSYGVTPDVMCLAKALAGGLPMGVCLARPEVARSFAPGDHASTFGGGPVQSAAALAVLDIIEKEGLLERARVAGRRLSAGLQAVFPGRKVRGRGLLIAVELGAPVARAVVEAALAEGVLVNDPTPSVLRVTPPLVITDEEIDGALRVLKNAYAAVMG
jgi:predicted acetylornithine/succinylornithine family transaminase